MNRPAMAACIGWLYNSNPGAFNIIGQLPAHLLENLKKTWDVAFREQVVPILNLKLFECLYSATMPSMPILLNVAALIIQQHLGLTDDEMVEGLHMRAVYVTRYWILRQAPNQR